MSTSIAIAPADGGAPSAPPFPSRFVEEMLRHVVRAARAHQLYLQNNPVYLRSIEQARAAITALWAHAESITLEVNETALVWEGAVVLSEPERSSDSLSWLLYKDGLREVQFHRGFEDELVGLLEILQRVRKASPDEDDLLTILWERDFLAFRYRYVDLGLETAHPLAVGEPVERPAVEAEPAPAAAPAPGLVKLEDFDSTLYFLDEHEIAYLRGEVDREYAADLRRNVLAILFDIFEQQNAPAVRDELCAILDNLVLHFLSAMDLPAVAYLMREAALIAGRAPDLLPAHRARLEALPERLSSPATLSQVIQALDDSATPPAQQELVELFEQLRGPALGTVFSWLPRLQSVRLRTLLEPAADRLAQSNTGELVRLIGSTDRIVVLEATRRAGAVRTPAAVAPLTRLVGEGDTELRLIAVRALGEIGSAGALQAVERALDDADRDVRVTAARIVAARGHRAALGRLEALVRGKGVREADLTEKMALFEAFGALCGDDGIQLLDGLLNGRGFMGRREEPELRACAAMALGRVGTPAARDALQRGVSDKEALVRNAASRALRGGGA